MTHLRCSSCNEKIFQCFGCGQVLKSPLTKHTGEECRKYSQRWLNVKYGDKK